MKIRSGINKNQQCPQFHESKLSTFNEIPLKSIYFNGDYSNVNNLHLEIGAEAKKFVSSGQLVPDDVMIKLIASELNRLDGDSWLLDGRYFTFVLVGMVS